jgi:hypothetical protein
VTTHRQKREFDVPSDLLRVGDLSNDIEALKTTQLTSERHRCSNAQSVRSRCHMPLAAGQLDLNAVARRSSLAGLSAPSSRPP